MPYVADWQRINPKDFVDAASQGGSLGARLGALATDAEMQKERLASQAAIESARLGASQQESGARLAQAAKEEEMNRALREWELKQQLAQKGTALQSQNERAANALAEKEQYGEGVLGIRQATNDLRSQQLDNAKAAAEAKASKAPPLMHLAPGSRLFQTDKDGNLVDVTPKESGSAVPQGPGLWERAKNFFTPGPDPLFNSVEQFNPPLVTPSGVSAVAPSPAASAAPPLMYSGPTGTPEAVAADAAYMSPINTATSTAPTLTAAPTSQAIANSRFRKGQIVKQRGKTYEFDGQQWIEIK